MNTILKTDVKWQVMKASYFLESLDAISSAYYVFNAIIFFF